MLKDLSDTALQAIVWFLVLVALAYEGYQLLKITKPLWM